MEEQRIAKSHKLVVNNRKTSMVTGVLDVLSFDLNEILLETQRGLARQSNVLMDGRDIGTVVLPDATLKIFLTASPEARATRRQAELLAKGQDADFDTVLADIRQRDYQDTHRAVAPLRQAEDAVLVDTSDMGIEESFARLKQVVLSRI